MAELTAKQVTEYILAFANEAGELVTNLKIQKMLYYAQGYYLGLNNTPLFNDKIQAWAHGPVVPSIYHSYKIFGWTPINKAVTQPTLASGLKEYLDIIIETFLPIEAFKLEQMTHQEFPWIKARGGLPPDAICQTEIDLNDMVEYFTPLAN